MSYNLSLIKIYPNVVNYHLTARDTGLNYDPENEPTITGESSTSSGGEADTGAQGKPAYDLVDNKIGSVNTIDTNGESSAPVIHLDTTTNCTVDTLIMANQNFTTAGAEYRVRYGGTPTTATMNTAYSGAQAVTGEWQSASDNVNSNYHTTPADGISIANFDSFTSNLFIVEFTTSEATYTADMTIGEVCFCQSWTAPTAPETPPWEDGSVFGNMSSESTGGGAFGTFFHGERKELTLMWKNLSQSNYNSLKTVQRITKGTTYPFWIDMGEHATLPYLRYVKFTDEIVGKPVGGGLYWNVIIKIKEVI